MVSKYAGLCALSVLASCSQGPTQQDCVALKSESKQECFDKLGRSQLNQSTIYGVLAGTLLGAALGAVITKGDAKGAAIGAAAGAAAGGASGVAYGAYQNQQTFLGALRAEARRSDELIEQSRFLEAQNQARHVEIERQLTNLKNKPYSDLQKDSAITKAKVEIERLKKSIAEKERVISHLKLTLREYNSDQSSPDPIVTRLVDQQRNSLDELMRLHSLERNRLSELDSRLASLPVNYPASSYNNSRIPSAGTLPGSPNPVPFRPSDDRPAPSPLPKNKSGV